MDSFFPKYLCLCLVLINPPLAFAGSYGVEAVPPGPKLVSPRAFVTVPFTIKNTGDTTDAFLPTVDLPQGWRTISSMPPLSLEPGQHKKKLITISIPSTAVSNLDYPITLSVTSQGDETVKASATALLRVKNVFALQLVPHPSPELAWAGEKVTCPFEIRNTGNSHDIFEIEAHSSLDWEVALSEKRLPLAPYEKKVVHVLLKVPRNVKQKELHTLTLRVVSLKARAKGKDISDEAKIRLTAIRLADKKERTCLELPGTIEIEPADITSKKTGSGSLQFLSMTKRALSPDKSTAFLGSITPFPH